MDIVTKAGGHQETLSQVCCFPFLLYDLLLSYLWGSLTTPL